MSIDARIELVTYEQNGTATLWLGKRERGQQQLTIVNPRPGLEILEGREIWGNSSQIMLGDAILADRLTYTTIKLRPPK